MADDDRTRSAVTGGLALTSSGRKLPGQEAYDKRVAEKGLPGIRNPNYQRSNIYEGSTLAQDFGDAFKKYTPLGVLGTAIGNTAGAISEAYRNRPSYSERQANYLAGPQPAPSAVQRSVPASQPAPQQVGTLLPYPEDAPPPVRSGGGLATGPNYDVPNPYPPNYQGTRQLRPINSMVNVFDLPDPYPGAGGAVGGYGGYGRRGGGGGLPNREGPNIVYLGENPNDPLVQAQKRTSALFDAALNERNGADRSALLRQALASADFARGVLGTQSDERIAGQRNLTTRDIAELTSRDRNRIADMDNQTRRDITAAGIGSDLFGIQTRSNDNRYSTDARSALGMASLYADAPLNQARTNYYNEQARIAGLPQPSYTVGDLMEGLQTGELDPNTNPVGFQTGIRALAANARTEEEKNFVRTLLDTYYPEEEQNYAEGGLVSAAMQGPLGKATPSLPPLESLGMYQQYADGARAMGLPVVGFEQFLGMSNGATRATAGAAGKQPMNFAEGGMVPDASGKMVIDPDPDAPTDSIPAMVDGEQPARLDSGEFVIPKDVVLYYGTDKLSKMIEKARNPEGNNGRSAIAGTA